MDPKTELEWIVAAYERLSPKSPAHERLEALTRCAALMHHLENAKPEPVIPDDVLANIPNTMRCIILASFALITASTLKDP